MKILAMGVDEGSKTPIATPTALSGNNPDWKRLESKVDQIIKLLTERSEDE